MKRISLLSIMLATPFLARAQEFTQLQNIIDGIQTVVDLLLPIAVTLAVLFFFWGLALFILGAGDESQRERGKNIMLWGIIALFIIVSVWGIIAFIGNLLGVGQGGSAPVPGVSNVAPDDADIIQFGG